MIDSQAVWLALVAGALLVGIAKTALPGLATLAVALFATVLPARESTAMLLVLLLTGDLVAIWAYRREADFRALRRLVPTVVAGLVLGALFLAWVDDVVMRRTIGVILLALTGLTVWGIRRGLDSLVVTGTGGRAAYGTLGGFTTMAANSGGPVMVLYFMAAGFDMARLMGTQAWFFFLVNVAKLPFSAGLGLFRAEMVVPLLVLAPVVLLGTWLGRAVFRRLNQTWFNRIVLVLTVVSALYLLR
ncbi:MAG: sulfite exporter TauE/SafE family protein [Arachnia propionica]|uniref:sulfite exporter TauE/SafE family protein n=1 Tax=Arachnia propionica TaxID=1750 RepID=UPI002708DB37|nr:sulfite exporter TauE/SafE family protein [Arachnia propionica]